MSKEKGNQEFEIHFMTQSKLIVRYALFLKTRASIIVAASARTALTALNRDPAA